MCVCVCKRERERERERDSGLGTERETERESASDVRTCVDRLETDERPVSLIFQETGCFDVFLATHGCEQQRQENGEEANTLTKRYW